MRNQNLNEKPGEAPKPEEALLQCKIPNSGETTKIQKYSRPPKKVRGGKSSPPKKVQTTRLLVWGLTLPNAPAVSPDQVQTSGALLWHLAQTKRARKHAQTKAKPQNTGKSNAGRTLHSTLLKPIRTHLWMRKRGSKKHCKTYDYTPERCYN